MGERGQAEGNERAAMGRGAGTRNMINERQEKEQELAGEQLAKEEERRKERDEEETEGRNAMDHHQDWP